MYARDLNNSYQYMCYIYEVEICFSHNKNKGWRVTAVLMRYSGKYPIL